MVELKSAASSGTRPNRMALRILAAASGRDRCLPKDKGAIEHSPALNVAWSSGGLTVFRYGRCGFDPDESTSLIRARYGLIWASHHSSRFPANSALAGNSMTVPTVSVHP
jgi:hypothetical protein